MINTPKSETKKLTTDTHEFHRSNDVRGPAFFGPNFSAEASLKNLTMLMGLPEETAHSRVFSSGCPGNPAGHQAILQLHLLLYGLVPSSKVNRRQPRIYRRKKGRWQQA